MKKLISIVLITIFYVTNTMAQNKINHLWASTPDEARPWCFWYWMQGAVSKEGITADLEAMKQAGISGTYLMPIKGVPEKPWVTPIVEQLSPLWWEMVDFAFKEADRVGVKIGFHICDGFALAGGPWITPELSMQKVVWATTNISGGKTISEILPQPESYKDYYEDIATFAYPTPQGEGISTDNIRPKVTSSIADIEPQFLVDPNNEDNFRSEDPCWILYAFDDPFTCRSIQVKPSGNNLQAQRLTIEASNDGVNFRKVVQLTPPRQGWQNTDQPMTHSIPETTAKYFRFQYDKSGTEPGSEDLDAGKWKQILKIKGIYLSAEARIHQYEGKNGSMWRVSPRTTEDQIAENLCVKTQDLIDITQYVDKNGKLTWKAPKGNWTILRMGHTSTGHTNATGGKGSGLESDKFNPEAIRLQFNSWFGKAVEVAGEDLASRVLKVFHVDSWECGSQNWSSNFLDEFKQRRGYDLQRYLPIMAGIPINDIDQSEKILYDVRNTISELVIDKFYKTLQKEANAKGCQFSAECVSPTMLSDGMLHYQNTDIPMGEYWLQSPTHDKPNDMLDAISGAHIYEKNIVQAESFTQLRTVWTEHPGMLKTLQDREYARGFNRLSYHVYVLNPWLDRKPGMTLDGIGLYFQRDQTWWRLGRAWVDYATRAQALLQFGKPVIDIAVFTGEELPRRAILPDRLVPILPGIFGEEKVNEEKARQANVGEPTRQMPVGVTHSANINDASQWVNSLRGYQYDSFNADALLRLAKAENGKIVLPGGMSYQALVIPGLHPMQPNPEFMSKEVADKISELAKQGIKILMNDFPIKAPGFNQTQTFTWDASIKSKTIGLPYTQETFDAIGISRDFIALENSKYAKDIAYTHRQGNEIDIYFISNQQGAKRTFDISLRETGRIPELWNPATGKISIAEKWDLDNGRTSLSLTLDENESVFVVLQETAKVNKQDNKSENTVVKTIDGTWNVSFDPSMRGPKETIKFAQLTSWHENADNQIKYYSGEAVYQNNFTIKTDKSSKYFITIDDVSNLAEVKVNGKSCGIIWTKPYKVDVTDAIRNGKNDIEITVVNTWANRIMGDEDFNAESDDSKRIWTNARYRMAEKQLQKSGIIGNVSVEKLSTK